jgi:DNA invertase Pin-like site-specific DNA recombinase
MDGKFVSYIRVSTQKQGRSGLGVEAQQEAVQQYLNGGRHKIVGEFIEVESGKRNDRPQLTKALQLCRAHKAQLLVAKLDRLARNVAFISALMEADVKFTAIDLPEANNLTVHVMAAMAEYEAKAISERTKAALAAVKARGEKQLGGRRMSRERWDEHAAKGRTEGRLARSRSAAAWAKDVMPVIESLQAEGAATLREIAAGLNERGIEARRGGEWNSVQVMRVLKAAQQEGGR